MNKAFEDKIKRAILTTIAIVLMLSNVYAAEIANIKPSQVGNRVVFQFDVVGKQNEETDVWFTLTISGKTYTSDNLHLEGDFEKTKTGKSKRIYWNVLQDFPKGFNETFKYDISAGGKEFKDPVTGMEMVYVKEGCFQMGNTFRDGNPDETPAHEVCVGGFYIGKYEVTQGQWKQIMGSNPSYFTSCGNTCPVENVSWLDVQEFIKKLNQKTGKNYRLPTEAEWEYAAKSGGKNEKYAGTSSESELGNYAWYYNNSKNKTHPVGQKNPNGFGIYDMSGNVWEWCADWYDENYYKNSSKNKAVGPNNGSARVIRGGSSTYDAWYLRITLRNTSSPLIRFIDFGFRLAKTK